MTNELLNGIWPEWSIVKQIGEGSYGVVYEVERNDLSVGSHAAVKVISIPCNETEIVSLRDEGLSDHEIRICFQELVDDYVREIQLMESFKGVQNIVSVEDYKVVEKKDELSWVIYIRMELLTPLIEHIQGHSFSEKDVIKLGIDICTALELCSKKNVIHRDVKPENIFVNQFGDYKLGDFGIACKKIGETGEFPQKGTYYYMAPEIARGDQYDATVDIYSLGLLLYRLTNDDMLPFMDNSLYRLSKKDRIVAVHRRLNGNVFAPPSKASLELVHIIMRACSYNACDRYQTASEMKNELINIANNMVDDKSDILNETVVVRHAGINEFSEGFESQTDITKEFDTNLSQSSVSRSNGNKSSQSSLFIDKAKSIIKSNSPLLIKVVGAVVLIVLSVWITQIIINKKDSTSDDNSKEEIVETSVVDEDNSNYSDFDKEQIRNTINDADALAMNGDYQGALAKIKTARAIYPDSKALAKKEEEYSNHLNEGTKQDHASSDEVNSNAIQAQIVQESSQRESSISADVHIDFPPVYMDAVSNVTATSFLIEKKHNISHDPFYVIDGTLENAWVEGVKGQGKGESLTMFLDNTYEISGFIIYAGYQKTEETYKRNSRPKQIRISFSSGQYVDIVLNDYYGEQRVSFSSVVESSSISFTLLSVYPGSKYQDTVISEIYLY